VARHGKAHCLPAITKKLDQSELDHRPALASYSPGRQGKQPTDGPGSATEPSCHVDPNDGSGTKGPKDAPRRAWRGV
ncbi:MAG TPA: hypothetical protein VNX17_07895, partial [Edaphobacter sp.]|nr:hypothetical protein [Edaphobacter sp.]